MTQPGETEGFSASDHLEALRKHGCADIIDGIVINNAKHLPPKLFEKYKKEGSHMVKADRPALAQWNMKIIEAPLLELDELARYAQHDSKNWLR